MSSKVKFQDTKSVAGVIYAKFTEEEMKVEARICTKK